MMHDMNLEALYPKPRTTIYALENKVYPYLLKDIVIERVNQVWKTDITYVKRPEGFIYLIGIIDVFSRFLIEHAYSNTLDSIFCLELLEKAFTMHGRPEILNSDQGSQFTSKAWTEYVENNGIKVSMDGRGRWADNIHIERFWRTLKSEHIRFHEFDNTKEAKRSISGFIETYNYRRLHQSMGYKTPGSVYYGLKYEQAGEVKNHLSY